MKLPVTILFLLIGGFINAQGLADKVKDLPEQSYSTAIQGPLRCLATSIPKTPLYVLDGYPVDSGTIKALDQGSIEKIEILKGSAQIAIYGSRGANGIISVTTKSRQFIVKDSVNNQPVPGAYVTFILIDNKSDSIVLTTDEKGLLTTNALQPKKRYEVKISSVGYNSWEGKFENNSKEKKQFTLSRNIVSNAPVIVISYGTTCSRIVITCGGGELIKKALTDSIYASEKRNRLKIFPNPVSRGNAINLELNAQNDSRLKSQILSLDGKLISTQNLTSNKGLNRLTIQTESRWAAGVYFIRVVDENGKPIQQEKFLVQ